MGCQLRITVGGMFCLCSASWRMARFLQIAAQLAIYHADYPAIAPLPQAFWALQISLFIIRVIGTTQKL